MGEVEVIRQEKLGFEPAIGLEEALLQIEQMDARTVFQPKRANGRACFLIPLARQVSGQFLVREKIDHDHLRAGQVRLQGFHAFGHSGRDGRARHREIEEVIHPHR